MLRITLKRSAIGRPEKQRRILRALGLTRLHKTVIKEDNPQIKGMIKAVSHLVHVEEV
jgi:large subunit ribosomal protein L30